MVPVETARATDLRLGTRLIPDLVQLFGLCPPCYLVCAAFVAKAQPCGCSIGRSTPGPARAKSKDHEAPDAEGAHAT